MNIFKALFGTKRTASIDYNEARKHVKKGGSLALFTVDEVRHLQELALNARDNEFYDTLERYWSEVRWTCR